ncbi:hypothetical protein [Microcoleus sp.]|uniref:hypothetical protein n=1 Tax=Microcoleus sp. TaxID=44472 RepID=UPI00352660C5
MSQTKNWIDPPQPTNNRNCYFGNTIAKSGKILMVSQFSSTLRRFDFTLPA